MKLSDVVHYSVKVLLERRTRSILTILGIMIGSSLIVSLVSNGVGLNVSVTENILMIGANNIIIVPSQGSPVRFTHLDVMRVASLPHVDEVLPFNTAPITIKGSGLTLNGRIISIDPSKINVLFPQLKMLEGRPPTPTDVNVVAIGHDLSRPPSQPGYVIHAGQSITVEVQVGTEKRTKSYTVSGVYDKFGASLFLDADSAVVLSLPAGRDLLQTDTYQGLLIHVRDVQMVNLVADELEKIYGRTVTVINPSSILNTVQQMINSFTLFLLTISAISLIVAGLGIANTMIMSVMERVREIGVLRAIGMTKRDVMILILSEGLLTGAIGGALGITMGVAFSIAMGNLIFSSFLRAGSSFSPIPYHPIITAELLAGTFLFAILIGTLSGLFPARRASNLDPVVALKTE